MGEKQIEVDKRLLRSRISALRRSIEVLHIHSLHGVNVSPITFLLNVPMLH